MIPSIIGLISAILVFGGALFGIWLQKYLPARHLESNTHEIVKLGSGMIGTLTALVLGLLVSSTKSSFDSMNSGIVEGSAKIIILDRALVRYGPETADARKTLQEAISDCIKRVWPDGLTDLSKVPAFEHYNEMETVQGSLMALKPQTDAQRRLLSQAMQLTDDLTQTRWLLIEQARSEIPWTFLVVLVFWLTVLFISFGMFTPRNATVVTVLFVCACSVSAALFLVLELNGPLDGIIKASNAPLRDALRHISQEGAGH